MKPIRIHSAISTNNYDASHYEWFSTSTGNIGCTGGGGCSRCKFHNYSADGCHPIQNTLYHLLKPASGFITIAYDDIVANYPEAFL